MSWLLQCPEGQTLTMPPGTELRVGAGSDCDLRLRGPGLPATVGMLSGTDDDVWLRVLADDPPVGVNGRPVRALARLAGGDRVCFGTFCVELLGGARADFPGDGQAVESFTLRARGGAGSGLLHHGPILYLDGDGAFVSAASGAIEIMLVDGRIRLGLTADAVVRVNGRRVDATVELKRSDQIQVGACRYLVETVSAFVPEPVTERLAAMSDAVVATSPEKSRGDVGSLWWLIGIAAFIAALVSALLYFHD